MQLNLFGLIKESKRAGGVTEVVEHLHSQCKALGSIARTTKEKEKRKSDTCYKWMNLENIILSKISQS
jgi:hypothetical protein